MSEVPNIVNRLGKRTECHRSLEDTERGSSDSIIMPAVDSGQNGRKGFADSTDHAIKMRRKWGCYKEGRFRQELAQPAWKMMGMISRERNSKTKERRENCWSSVAPRVSKRGRNPVPKGKDCL